jgi:hypothetical protein
MPYEGIRNYEIVLRICLKIRRLFSYVTLLFINDLAVWRFYVFAGFRLA